VKRWPSSWRSWTGRRGGGGLWRGDQPPVQGRGRRSVHQIGRARESEAGLGCGAEFQGRLVARTGHAGERDAVQAESASPLGQLPQDAPLEVASQCAAADEEILHPQRPAVGLGRHEADEPVVAEAVAHPDRERHPGTGEDLTDRSGRMTAQRQVELGGAGRELRDSLRLLLLRGEDLHPQVQLLQVLSGRRRLRGSPPAPGLHRDQGTPGAVLRGPAALQRQLPRPAQRSGERLRAGRQVDDRDPRVSEGHLGPLRGAVVDEDQRLHREAELLGDLVDGDGLRPPARPNHREVAQGQWHIRVGGEHRTAPRDPDRAEGPTKGR